MSKISTGTFYNNLVASGTMTGGEAPPLIEPMAPRSNRRALRHALEFAGFFIIMFMIFCVTR